MNDQLQQAAGELLTLVNNNVIAGVEIAKTQFPDLCKQIMLLGMWDGVMGIFWGILCLFVAGFILWRGKKKHDTLKKPGYEPNYELLDWTPGYFLLAMSIFILGIFLFSIGLDLLVKVILAPKIYLLEKLRSFI